MKLIIALSFLLVILVGCSSSFQPVAPSIIEGTKAQSALNNHWLWGYWQFYIPGDRSRIEVVPVRVGDYHFCVTIFLETFPCHDCLNVSSPDIQPDGSLKYDVTLRHPFVNAPKYTGFDVRGMVYFPPTQEHISNLYYGSYNFDGGGDTNPLFDTICSQLPVKFSRASDGGAELLNADGYSCYMIPGLKYSNIWPIFSYYPPNNGIEPTPQTTVTPYKLFCSENERRAFFVSDELTREYHLVLPEGPFTFGYAVDASWWPPNNVPVTDPLTDFPLEANAEDPWKIEFEQLVPICEENVGKDLFKVTIHHRGFDEPGWIMRLYLWDMFYSPLGYPHYDCSPSVPIDWFTDELYCPLSDEWWDYVGDLIEPGEYMGVLFVEHSMDGQWPKNTMLRLIYAATFVNVVVSE